MILVSACLLGVRCRYDGASEGPHPELAGRKDLLPVCPEQLGGLPTPREGADFINPNLTGEAVLKGETRVTTASGKDVTKQYLTGALEAARLAEICKIKKAYLRRRSPSCGFGKTNCRGRVIDGNGVFAAKLHEMGVEIITLGKPGEP